MPLRLHFQLNVRTIHSDFVEAQPCGAGGLSTSPVLTLNLAPCQGQVTSSPSISPSERAAAMRTGIVDGVELTVQVEQGDLLSLHLNQFPVVRFKLARLRYFDIFGHANLLDPLTFLRRALVVRQSAAKQDVPSVTCRRTSRGGRQLQSPSGSCAASH